MIIANDNPQSIQERFIRQRQERKVPNDGCAELGYLAAMPLGLRVVSVNIQIAERKPSGLGDLKSKGVLQ